MPITYPDFEIELTLLLEAIFLQYKYDFRNYSRVSMRRRIIQAIHQLNCVTVSSLQKKIIKEPQSFLQLLQFLTIPVSEMFRDPSYFRTIREKVIPLLRTYPSFKIWIAGCSTGEEVYSFAILLKEEDLLERTIIYATDINASSLEKAEAGIFRLNDIELFSENYKKSGAIGSFSDYYTTDVDSVKFDKSLRKNITFSDHSLSTDSVFSETQFISCRNVLIYFNKELKERAFGLFHDSLCRHGFLGLGSKETTLFSSYAPSFDQIVKTDRIYQKNDQRPTFE